MKIYTRVGDDGTTSLVGGERVPKTDPRIDAYGTVDELIANLAFLRDHAQEASLDDTLCNDLLTIMGDLMIASALLASKDLTLPKLPQLGDDRIGWLEGQIDEIQSQLPPLYKFTIPGGAKVVSLSHICRTVCRRAERCTIRAAEQAQIPAVVISYLNRLSDYLYVFGRKATLDLNINELEWDVSK